MPKNLKRLMRGLVRDPKDWPWSSYSHYAMGKEGLVRVDDGAQGVKRESKT
jgi:hypothetical protein